MAVTENIQSIFLEQIKTKLKPNTSFADELAEILNISRDSAYRRIRGETVLSLDESKLLCLRYGISLDNLISASGNMVSFHYRVVDGKNFTFENWLKSVLANLETLLPFPEKQLIYFAKDIPVFYYFKSPLLGPFKMFFWMSSVLKNENFRGVKFHPDLVSTGLVAIGNKIFKLYCETPRIEIWSDETLSVTLRQIEFYHECSFFSSPAQGGHLCDELLQVMRRVRDWAAHGKNDRDGKPYNLFKNEILIADNTFLFRMKDRREIFINHNTLNILTTRQQSFCLQTEHYLLNLLNKATKISGTGERERVRFFNTIEEKIKALKKKVSA